MSKQAVFAGNRVLLSKSTNDEPISIGTSSLTGECLTGTVGTWQHDFKPYKATVAGSQLKHGDAIDWTQPKCGNHGLRDQWLGWLMWGSGGEQYYCTIDLITPTEKYLATNQLFRLRLHLKSNDEQIGYIGSCQRNGCGNGELQYADEFFIPSVVSDPTQKLYNLTNGECVESPTGQYSWQSCQDMKTLLKTSWNCEDNVCTEVSGTGGTYPTEDACQTACSAAPPHTTGWSCVNNECIETDEYEYTLRSQCLTECGSQSGGGGGGGGTSDSGGGGLSTGAIVGIALGAVVLLVIIVMVSLKLTNKI